MDHTHPLSLALSSHIPVSPGFIYLHHPFHSSAYALPRSLTHGRSEDGKEQRDEVEQDDIRRVVVVVDVAALGDNTTNTFSQKAFYNAVLRQLFASITTKISLLEQHASLHSNGKTMPAEIEIVHPSPKQSGKKGPTTTTAAAITAFHARFTLITQKDVYRWDVFLLRLAAMMRAFSSVLSTLPQDEPCVGPREAASLTLVILEGHLLPKCLGGTWHAILRLNEMASPTVLPWSSFPLVPLFYTIETFDTTLVLCSTRAWDDVRPMTGDAAEPYHLFLRAPNKNETLSALRKHNSHPLFPYFLDLLYTASCHLVPLDLIPESEKLAKVLWVVYMLPLDGFRHRESTAIHLWDDEPLADAPAADAGPADLAASSDEPLRITYQLLTDLKNQSSYAFAAANESLIPHRCTGARFLDVFTGERKRRRREMEEFARALHGHGREGEGGGAWFALANQVRQEQPPAARQTTVDPIITHLSGLPTTKPPPPPPRIPKPPIPRLPLYAKYLILAAYCASYNSPRTDLRMFGRGPLTLRGKTRRSGVDGAGAGRGYEGSGSAGKKVGAGLKKLKTTTTTLGKAGARVPQALLGPKSFPLERMLAVFQSLLAEHGFRQEAYHSDEFSDSGSEAEGEGMSSGPSEDGGGGADDMRTEGKNGPPGSPSRRGSRKRKATTAGNDGGGVLDFRVVDEQAERIERKRRRENEMLRSWEEEVEEISRSVGLFALIRELEGLRLLNRISPRDRLDNILLRCEAPKEMVLEFARQVKVDLASYLVEGD